MDEVMQKPPRRHKALLIIVALLFIIALCAAIYFYTKYDALKATPAVSTPKDVAALVARVGRLIVLPTDETPTIATVTDLEKLKDQPFFANAKNGDKVLLYSKARKAILYDPVADKIIEVAPVNLDRPAASALPRPAAASTPEAAIKK